jgi:hypothetical protein
MYIYTEKLRYKGGLIMGRDANIICVGCFQPHLKDMLDYGKGEPYDDDWYEDTQEGSLVTKAGLLNCNTSDQSTELAKALGVEYWDFNTHQLKKEKIDWNALIELSEECAEWDEKNVENLRTLLEHKFICMFQPNG